jgi:hypothetical protein
VEQRVALSGWARHHDASPDLANARMMELESLARYPMLGQTPASVGSRHPRSMLIPDLLQQRYPGGQVPAGSLLLQLDPPSSTASNPQIPPIQIRPPLHWSLFAQAPPG